MARTCAVVSMSFRATRQDDSQVSSRLSSSYGRSSTTVRISDEFANLMRVGALRIAFGLSAIRCKFVILFRVARKTGNWEKRADFPWLIGGVWFRLPRCGRRSAQKPLDFRSRDFSTWTAGRDHFLRIIYRASCYAQNTAIVSRFNNS
jgi:hypothetical protein